MLRLGAERAGVADIESLVEGQFDRFIEFYAADIDRHTRLYPGAEAAIGELRQHGMKTGICTNKPEAQAIDLIDKLGVAHLFDSFIAADTLPTRKPDPAPMREAVQRAGGDLSNCALIGDTETDRETARRSNVPCVLVTFGPDGEDIRQLEADAYLDDYIDLGAVVSRTLDSFFGASANEIGQVTK